MSQTIDMWERECDLQIANLQEMVDEAELEGQETDAARIEFGISCIRWAVSTMRRRLVTGQGRNDAD